LGDRETRIWVAWHMGVERNPWELAPLAKGFLTPNTLPAGGSLLPRIGWFQGLVLL
jgi:hypothetical protein